MAETEKKDKNKKSAKKRLLALYIAAALIFCGLGAFSLVFFNRSDYSVGGLGFYTVSSDSMADGFLGTGSVAVCIKTDPEELVEGDVISYLDPSAEGGILTLKIRSVNRDEKGNLYFITYGTESGETEDIHVPADAVLGKYVMALPGAGTVYGFLLTPAGMVFSALVLVLLIVCVILSAREKKAAMAAAAEKEENAAKSRSSDSDNDELLSQLLEFKAGIRKTQEQKQNLLEGSSEPETGDAETPDQKTKLTEVP